MVKKKEVWEVKLQRGVTILDRVLGLSQSLTVKVYLSQNPKEVQDEVTGLSRK